MCCLTFVVCSLLVLCSVCWGALYVVCCLLFVVCSMLYVVWLAVCCSLFEVCGLLFMACRGLLFGVRSWFVCGFKVCLLF